MWYHLHNHHHPHQKVHLRGWGTGSFCVSTNENGAPSLEILLHMTNMFLCSGIYVPKRFLLIDFAEYLFHKGEHNSNFVMWRGYPVAAMFHKGEDKPNFMLWIGCPVAAMFHKGNRILISCCRLGALWPLFHKGEDKLNFLLFIGCPVAAMFHKGNRILISCCRFDALW